MFYGGLQVVVVEDSCVWDKAFLFSCILVLIKSRNSLISLTHMITLSTVMLVSENLRCFRFLLFNHFNIVLIFLQV